MSVSSFLYFILLTLLTLLTFNTPTPKILTTTRSPIQLYHNRSIYSRLSIILFGVVIHMGIIFDIDLTPYYFHNVWAFLILLQQTMDYKSTLEGQAVIINNNGFRL